MMLIVAATVVLVGMRLAAPILNPALFAVVFALLFSPVYAWLGRCGLPGPLIFLVMVVGLSALFPTPSRDRMVWAF
jgi:predicted PurR-regulated permease PerM